MVGRVRHSSGCTAQLIRHWPLPLLAAITGAALRFTAWHIPSRYFLASGGEGHAGDLGSVVINTALPVLLMGLIFGVLWDRYRRLLPLIALH